MSKTVFIFGDEVGVPATLDSLPGSARPVVILDPFRHCRMALPDTVATLPFPDKANRDAFAETVRQHAPSLGIINSFSRILWPELLDMFPLGVVNMHLSKLPEYRGANTLQWTLINGETTTAATLHTVDQGIDTGPVIGAHEIDIDPGDTALTLQHKLLKASDQLLTHWLPLLLTTPVKGTAQDESKARYWPRRTPDDGEIHWEWPDERIRNMTRALVSPWPGAWFRDRNGNRTVIKHALSTSEIKALRREVSQ